MQAQRRADTGPELALRHSLWRIGLRYRLHRRPVSSLRREADVVFIGAKVAVFSDGCLWHGHSCRRPPGGPNAEWWADKLARTRARDRDTDQKLMDAGWRVVRVWECENPDVAAQRIAALVRGKRSGAEQ